MAVVVVVVAVLFDDEARLDGVQMCVKEIDSDELGWEQCITALWSDCGDGEAQPQSQQQEQLVV